MAVYKVPQDVEAEDKLVGPFGFRQFVYLGIAGGLTFVGYLLLKISPFLAVAPVPIIAFLVILALPLRKEQPMETYLLALVRFYFKPKLRMWNPDGTITYVEIVAPRILAPKLSKDLAGEAASERLDYLARLMDSRGWSLKNAEQPGASLKTEIAAEAQTVTDVMDEGAALAQSFDTKIAQKDQERREQVMQQMQKAKQEPPTPAGQLPANDFGIAPPLYNPYPTSMHQRVIQPLGAQATATVQDQATPAPPMSAAKKPAATPASAMPTMVSPDIIRLANNDDLSISAIAHEAHRLATKEGEEVVINLH